MMGKIIIFTTAVTALGLVVSLIIHRSKGTANRKRLIGKLSEIIIYPLKAGCGVSLNEAYCSDVGLIEEKSNEVCVLGDRHFIAYDATNGMRISCKDRPFICKIKLTRADNSFVLTAPGFEKFHLLFPDKLTNKVNCMIYYNIPSETIDCGEDVAAWLSKVLRLPSVRLGIYVKNKIKKRKDTAGMLKNYKAFYPEMNRKCLGAYTFLASYLMINQSSLDELNTRLPKDEVPATSLRFRSNLTIAGEIEPYDEDNWKWIKIGENVILKNFKPCTRCIVITLNPETAEFSKHNEPLNTLKKYRLLPDPEKNRVENWSPVFGQYFGLHQDGYIKVGDPVYVLEDLND